MAEDEPMTANQLWKNSNTTLGFKEWISNEKEKDTFIKNDTLASILNDSKLATGVTSPDPETSKSNKIFGINKSIVYVSATVIVIAIGYRIYKNSK